MRGSKKLLPEKQAGGAFGLLGFEFAQKDLFAGQGQADRELWLAAGPLGEAEAPKLARAWQGGPGQQGDWLELEKAAAGFDCAYGRRSSLAYAVGRGLGAQAWILAQARPGKAPREALRAYALLWGQSLLAGELELEALMRMGLPLGQDLMEKMALAALRAALGSLGVAEADGADGASFGQRRYGACLSGAAKEDRAWELCKEKLKMLIGRGWDASWLAKEAQGALMGRQGSGQARSMGFSMIFAGTDWLAMERRPPWREPAEPFPGSLWAKSDGRAAENKAAFLGSWGCSQEDGLSALGQFCALWDRHCCARALAGGKRIGSARRISGAWDWKRDPESLAALARMARGRFGCRALEDEEWESWAKWGAGAERAQGEQAAGQAARRRAAPL